MKTNLIWDPKQNNNKNVGQVSYTKNSITTKYLQHVFCRAAVVARPTETLECIVQIAHE